MSSPEENITPWLKGVPERRKKMMDVRGISLVVSDDAFSRNWFEWACLASPEEEKQENAV